MCIRDSLLAAKLRPSDIDVALGADTELERIVGQIRESWPKVKIIVRGDSGFCREWLMSWCEKHRVDDLFGVPRNTRLRTAIVDEMQKA